MAPRTGPRLVRRGRIWYTWVPKPGGGTRRVGTSCTDKDAARDKARELERLATNPAHQAAYKTTTRELADRYIGSRKRAGRAAGTLHHYEVKCSHLVRLMPRMIAHITLGVVERYADAREREGAAKTTVKKELRALKAMLRYGKRAGLWLGDLDAVIPEYEDTYEPRTRTLSWLEAVALLKALQEPDNAQPVDRAMNRAGFVAFSLATGARFGETQRAQRDDFAKGAVYIRGTKTKAAKREVPIVGFALALMDYVWRCVGDRKGRLFDAWRNPVRDLEVACKQANIAKVTANDLRRTYASWMLAAGLDLDTVRRLLGHTSTRMLERVYGQVSSQELRARVAGRLLDHPGDKKDLPRLLLTTAKPAGKR